MKSYPSYKDSGVGWIGEIPDSWNTKRISHFFVERNETVDDRSYPPLSVTMNGIQDQLEGAAKTVNNDNRKKVCKGDFVINSRSDRKGSSGVSFRDGSVSVISIVLEPISIHPQYAHHLLRSYLFIEEFFRHGKGIHFDLWSTKYTTMKNIEIPDFSLQEQQKISNYLDHKTQQIDSLIDKTQQKIELLKEQRISLIHHVVTKGLDPNVEMKESGVEWIGEIPSRWLIISVRILIGMGELEIQDGNHGEIHPKSDDYVDEGIPFILSNNIISGEVDYTNCNKINKEQADSLRIGFSKAGDILLSHKGSIGKVAFVDRTPTDYIMLTPQVTYYRTKMNVISNKYLFHYFQSYYFQEMMLLLSSDGSTRNYIGIIDQRNLNIITPPISEQQQIVNYLDKETTKIDSLVEKETQRIKLLKEYRQSLISEVVTGKVDVRNEVVV